MGDLKSFARYLVGADINEEQRRYFAYREQQRERIGLFDGLHYTVYLATRYASLGLEIDGIRRIFEGQYLEGAVELVAAEYIRGMEYLSRHNPPSTSVCADETGACTVRVASPSLETTVDETIHSKQMR